MSRREIELALKKQRLRMRSAALRDDLTGYAHNLTPLLHAADRCRAAAQWLRRHPALPVVALTALFVARPRALLRWARRGWFAWQTLRRVRSLIPAKQLGFFRSSR